MSEVTRSTSPNWSPLPADAEPLDATEYVARGVSVAGLDCLRSDLSEHAVSRDRIGGGGEDDHGQPEAGGWLGQFSSRHACWRVSTQDNSEHIAPITAQPRPLTPSFVAEYIPGCR